MTWDVIVAGAGNAGLCAAHAARERGARVLVLEKADEAWSGGNSAFTAGAIRFAHGGLEDVRSLVEEDERLAATDLDPYSAEDFAADLRRVTLGRGDEAMARVLAGDSAAAVRWLRGKGLRFRLMYERQANEVDGRQRFWGGLAVGTVDGGEGLMAQHRAAAARDGIELRHGAAVEDLLRGEDGAFTGVAVRYADGTREELRRARRSCSPPAASSRTRRCAPPTSARTGTWRRSAAPRTTPARCCAPRSPTAPRPTATGAAATRSSGTPARRRPATASSPTATRASPIRWRSWSTPTASASSTRAPTSATTRTPSTAPRCYASRRGSRRRSSTRTP